MRTAVERLQAKLWENNILTNEDLKLFKEALEIEKEQIEMAFFKGLTFGKTLPDGLTAEQYYSESFKQQEQ
jgi:hypothetical protein